MSENNKDPIEEFFRDKSLEYDIPYREEDWEKLENKLNLADARRTYRRRIQLLAAAALLLVSLLGYFTYDNYNRLNMLTEQMDSDIPLETVEPPQPKELSPIDSDLPAPDHTEPLTEIEPERDGMLPDIAVQDEQEDMPRADIPEATKPTESTFYDRDLIAKSDILEIPPLRPISAADLTPPRESPHAPISAIKTTPSFGGYYEDHTADQPGTFTSSRLSVGLTIAPDLTTVNSISNFFDPGYKFGINIDYELSSRLSVQTGLNPTMVRYSAQTGEYNPPIYWAEESAPNEMIGECLLLDIPIGLKFDFLHGSRSRFYSTIGLSSYYMLQEDYHFSYREGTGDGQIEHWRERNGGLHWFNNAGFSIGYELDIHPNFSLRAEPYLKVPLRGVGWSDVSIYSLGSSFSISYSL